jgi:hypothetical protein
VVKRRVLGIVGYDWDEFDFWGAFLKLIDDHYMETMITHLFLFHNMFWHFSHFLEKQIKMKHG